MKKKFKFYFVLISVTFLLSFTTLNVVTFHIKFFQGLQGPSVIINPLISDFDYYVYEKEVSFFYNANCSDNKKTIIDDFTYQFLKDKPDLYPITYSFGTIQISPQFKDVNFEFFLKNTVSAACVISRCSSYKYFHLSPDYQFEKICFNRFD